MFKLSNLKAPETKTDWLRITATFAFFQVIGNLYFIQFDPFVGSLFRGSAIAMNLAIFILSLRYFKTEKGFLTIVLMWRVIILFQCFVCYGVTDDRSQLSMAFIMLGGILFVEDFSPKFSPLSWITAIFLILALSLPQTYELHSVEPYSQINLYGIIPLVILLSIFNQRRRHKLTALLEKEQHSAKMISSLMGLLFHNVRGPVARLELIMSSYESLGKDKVELSTIAPSIHELFSLANLSLSSQQASQKGNLSYEQLTDELSSLTGIVPIIDDGVSLENPLNLEEFLSVFLSLDNLVGNAKRYSRERVNIHVRKSQYGIHICVEDDGPGFNRSGDNHRPLSETREKYDSLGVGMELSRKLLELVGWELSIKKSTGSHTIVELFKSNSSLKTN